MNKRTASDPMLGLIVRLTAASPVDWTGGASTRRIVVRMAAGVAVALPYRSVAENMGSYQPKFMNK